MTPQPNPAVGRTRRNVEELHALARDCGWRQIASADDSDIYWHPDSLEEELVIPTREADRFDERYDAALARLTPEPKPADVEQAPIEDWPASCPECGALAPNLQLTGQPVCDHWFHRPSVGEPYEPADCRSIEGETVGLIDAAIHVLRFASRADLTTPAAREALKDFASDPEVQAVIRAAAELSRTGPAMSGTVTGAMADLETDLANYPERGDPNRSLVIRKALRAAEERGWQEGYSDGLIDGHDRRKPGERA